MDTDFADLNFLNDEEGGDQEEHESVKEEFQSDRDSILILIDANLSMFQKNMKQQEEEQQEGGSHSSSSNSNEELQIPFLHAVKCAAQIYCDKIVAGNDLMGTVFYGTDKSKNQFDFNNVYIYHDVDVPDADRIKQLEALSKSNNEQIEKLYGHASKKGSLHDALWTCQHLFSHVPKNVAFKRIFLFTNDDDPFEAGDANIRKKCLERAKDLMESDIMLELFVLGSNNSKFDPSLFWSHVIYRSDDEYTGQIYIDGARSFQQLLEGVKQKSYTKRVQSSFELELIPSRKDASGSTIPAVSLSVNMYSPFVRVSLPLRTLLEAETNKPIVRSTRYVCPLTGAEVQHSDLLMATTYGKHKIGFTENEIKQIENFGTKGIKLLGFKPRSRLKIYHNVKPCGFLYPTDANISGSYSAFSALHKKMIEMNRIAICREIARDGSCPQLVALVPQEEKVDPDDHETQTQPPGFNLIYLPYVDDMRDTSSIPFEQATVLQKQIDKAKIMIKKLNVDMANTEFDNPSIQRHRAIVTALALDRDNVAEYVDHLQPDLEGMRKYQAEMDDFKQSVLPSDYAPEPAAKPKRKKTGDYTPRTPKYEPDRKKARMDVDLSDSEREDEPIDMVSLAKKNQMNKLTVPVLQEFCKVYNIKPKGKKKADIIEAILSFLTEHKKI